MKRPAQILAPAFVVENEQRAIGGEFRRISFKVLDFRLGVRLNVVSFGVHVKEADIIQCSMGIKRT